jgi:plastocyanin
MPPVRGGLAVALLGTVLLLPAWPAGAQPAKPATKATIDGTPQLKWQPADVTVAVGGTVTFRIVGATPHPVGSGSGPPKDDGKFDTSGCQLGDMGKDGASCTVTFKKAGSYPYFCQLHYATGMVGTITVGGGDGTGASTATTTATAGAPAGDTSVVATPKAATPTGSGRPAIYWAGYGLFALGALLALVTLFAYVRYAPRFGRPGR